MEDDYNRRIINLEKFVGALYIEVNKTNCRIDKIVERLKIRFKELESRLDHLNNMETTDEKD